MGTATRIFYATLIAYLVQLDTFPGVVSSPTPFFSWVTEESSSLSSSTTTTSGQQDGAANTSFSPFEPEFIASYDKLCHPACECLDTFFDCRKRGLTEFPADFPPFVVTL